MKLHYRDFRHGSSCVKFAKISHYMNPEYAMSSQGYSRTVHCDDCCLAAEETFDKFLLVQVSVLPPSDTLLLIRLTSSFRRHFKSTASC
jgi:hypothetical protein